MKYSLCLVLTCAALTACGPSTKLLKPSPAIPAQLLTEPVQPRVAENEQDVLPALKDNMQGYGECLIQLQGLIEAVEARQ